MAQSKDLAALRMRLVRRGYDRVWLSAPSEGVIQIVAYEPLGGQEVRLLVKREEVNFIGRW